MAIFVNIAIAFHSLKSNPLRSTLTLTGIAVGIAAVLYVVVLGQITQERINERLESLGSNVLVIRPGYSRMRGVRTGASVVNLTWQDSRDIVTGSDMVVSTVPVYSGQGNTEYRDRTWSTRVTGTTPGYSVINNDFPIDGRFFTEEELDRRAQVCLLGATVHEKLFGSGSPVGESILLNSKRFLVIGLLGVKGEGWSSPDDQVFMPITTAQERLYGVDHLSSILAQMKAEGSDDEALFDIETILRRNHRLREDQDNDFRVRRQDFFLSTIQDTNAEIANFIVLIAFVSLAVGGIGIANVMLVSVTERTREIGIRRAMGARRKHILTQFLVESAILGLFGGLLGIVGGMTFNHFNIGAGLILPWNWIGYSFGICAGIGVLAGIYPAMRAASEDVIRALHHE